ncbi:MAG TPA: hypothetical protein VKM54_09895 [Myxococcota bacterium]|nr:hypothetical protein [Myxococcota bacterium]
MRSSTDADPFVQILGAKDTAPLLHELRERDPVHFVTPLGFWFVTRYDDVKWLFNDTENVTHARHRSAWISAARGPAAIPGNGAV